MAIQQVPAIIKTAEYTNNEKKRCYVPRHWFVMASLFFAYVLSSGVRANFAMVMTHLSVVDNEEHEENIFPNCTVGGTGRDYSVSWTGSQIALLHTAQAIGETVMQIPVGMLCLRYPPRKVLGIGYILTGIMYLVIPEVIQHSYLLTLVFRLIQGCIEAVATPAVYGILTTWTVPSSRSSFVGAVNSGAYYSPVLALLLSGVMSCYVSWASSLYVYGAAFVLWGVSGLLFIHDTPLEDPSVRDEERQTFLKHSRKRKIASADLLTSVPWKSILTSCPVFATLVAAFCRNWVVSIIITQEPQYFKDSFGQNSATIGLLSCVPHFLMGMTSMSAGFIFDSFVRKGWLRLSLARKIAHTVGFGGEAVFMIGLYFVESHQWKLAFALLSIGVGISGFITAGFQSDQLDLAPRYATVIVGFTRIGVSGGIASTAFAATIVGNDHDINDWQLVFLLTGIISLGGVIFYDIFSSSHVQPWAVEEEEVLLIVDEKTALTTTSGRPPAYIANHG